MHSGAAAPVLSCRTDSGTHKCNSMQPARQPAHPTAWVVMSTAPGRLAAVPFTAVACGKESHNSSGGGVGSQATTEQRCACSRPSPKGSMRTSMLYCVAGRRPATMQSVAVAGRGWAVQVWLALVQLVALLCRHTLSRSDAQPPAGVVAGCMTSTVALVWLVAFTASVGALWAREGQQKADEQGQIVRESAAAAVQCGSRLALPVQGSEWH